ncbi:MAG: permease [Betaproteobacteria bacterium]|nr:permease [Betaproteobacteria bacterium]
MSELTVLQWLFFAVVVFVSYAIRGSTGFGGVTVPLLALIMSVKTVAPMVTVLGILSSGMILRNDYRHIAWAPLRQLLPWCGLGVGLGVYLFANLDSETLGNALGIFAIGYGAHSMWRTITPAPDRRLPMKVITPLAGSVGGFVGSLFGASAGMFFAMYLDLLKLPKIEFRATVAAVLVGLGVMRGAGYLWAGAFDREALVVCAAALPAMALGVWAGNHLHTNLDEIKFKRFVAVVLILSGVPLLLR